jgi:hypothetical protein
LALLLTAALLPACHVAVIEGTVVDIKGETLPGVAVRVDGKEATIVTDIHGRYRVPYEPGAITLSFMKTGYTPGRLELDVGNYRTVEAATVSLWPVPQSSGVFLFENSRYRDVMRLQPERWDTMSQGSVYGTERWADVETPSDDPLILCYRMPRNGMKLYQLDLTEVTPKYEQATSDTIEIWAPTRAIPVSPVPIDEVDGLLVKVGLPAPLEPGSYAVHWGALDGDNTYDESRMFLFHVAEQYPMQPLVEEPPAESGTEATEAAAESALVDWAEASTEEPESPTEE